jgi:hypothetical protein
MSFSMLFSRVNFYMIRTKNDTGSNNNQPCFDQLVNVIKILDWILLLLQQCVPIGTFHDILICCLLER